MLSSDIKLDSEGSLECNHYALKPVEENRTDVKLRTYTRLYDACFSKVITMRAIIIAVTMWLGFADSGATGPITTNALHLYVVSERPIAGGRFIDTPAFPKLGYISNSPSLVISRLREVRTNDQTNVMVYGASQMVETNITPSTTITMFPDDVKRFAELTRRNVNAKLLFMWRDQLLMAPKIVAEIEAGIINLAWERRRFPPEVIAGIQALQRRK